MTPNFRDPDNREWKLRLTVGGVADVKRDTGVDIGSITQSDTKWIEFLFGDSARLVQVLWVLCEPQATKAGISPEQFGHLFDGPTLEAAGMALAGAIADFFPRSRVAQAIRQSLTKILDAADRKMVAMLEEKSSTFSEPVTNSPGSAESIPAG